MDIFYFHLDLYNFINGNFYFHLDFNISLMIFFIFTLILKICNFYIHLDFKTIYIVITSNESMRP